MQQPDLLESPAAVAAKPAKRKRTKARKPSTPCYKGEGDLEFHMNRESGIFSLSGPLAPAKTAKENINLASTRQWSELAADGDVCALSFALVARMKPAKREPEKSQFDFKVDGKRFVITGPLAPEGTVTRSGSDLLVGTTGRWPHVGTFDSKPVHLTIAVVRRKA